MGLKVTLGNRRTTAEMNLKVDPANKAIQVSLSDILDYGAFSRRYRDSTETSELHLFEKFHAARILLREGFDVYLDAKIVADDASSTIQADACGIKGDQMTLVFCTPARPKESTWLAIRTVKEAENAQSVILSPEELEREEVQRHLPGILEDEKVRFETLGWFDDTLEETFQRTLKLIELVVNETRMRMLAPLFQKPGVKKEYRARINPKLVYHNLTALSRAGLVDEPIEGTYELSPLGKTVMAEFISFLEKTRRTLDDYGEKEVN